MTGPTVKFPLILTAVPHHVESVRLSRARGQFWGRWREILELLREIKARSRDTAYRFTPALTKAEQRSLRSAAGWRGWGIHIRTGSDASLVWLGGEIVGYGRVKEKRRKDK